MRKNPHPRLGSSDRERPHGPLRPTSSPRFFYAVIAAALLTFGGLTAPSAQATLITYFNFEDGNLISDPAVPPSFLATTMTTDFVAGVNGYSFPALEGSILNPAPGNIELASAPLRLDTDQGANNGRWIQFDLNTTFLSNMALTYATRHVQGQAFTAHTLSYSVNGGAFVTVGTFVPNSNTNAYELATFNLGGITAIEGQTSVTFRITFTGAGNCNNEFTDIDNLQLNATAIVPEPSTWVAAGLALVVLGFTQRRRWRGLITRRGS